MRQACPLLADAESDVGLRHLRAQPHFERIATGTTPLQTPDYPSKDARIGQGPVELAVH